MIVNVFGYFSCNFNIYFVCDRPKKLPVRYTYCVTLSICVEFYTTFVTLVGSVKSFCFVRSGIDLLYCFTSINYEIQL